MEDLEYLESMKQSVATVIHIINLKFDPKKKQLFTVFEGKEDRTYYIPRIKILLKDYAYDEIVEVIAYCKNNVISVNESIDWNRYSYNQFIFFTDTDLDYWLNKATPEASNLYYTDYYSVENYCVNPTVFKEFLLNIEGFSIVDSLELESMMSLFDEWVKAFEKDMRQTMGTAIVAKRNDPNLTLSTIKFTENTYSLKYDNGRFINTINYDIIRNKLHIDSCEFDQQIEEQVAYINEHLDYYSVHGKWLLTAMARLAEYFRLNAMTFAPSLKRKIIKPATGISVTQVFPIVSAYDIISIPESLISIVKNNFEQYLSA